MKSVRAAFAAVIVAACACTPVGQELAADKRAVPNGKSERRADTPRTQEEKAPPPGAAETPQVRIERDDGYLVVTDLRDDEGRPIPDETVTIKVTPVAVPGTAPIPSVIVEASVLEDIAVEQPVVVTIVDNATGEVIATETVVPPPAEPELAVDAASNTVTISGPENNVEVVVTVLTEEGDTETLTSSEGLVTMQPGPDGTLVVDAETDGEIIDVEVTAQNDEGEESDPVAVIVPSHPAPTAGTTLATLEERLNRASKAIADLVAQRKALKMLRKDMNKRLAELRKEAEKAAKEAEKAAEKAAKEAEKDAKEAEKLAEKNAKNEAKGKEAKEAKEAKEPKTATVTASAVAFDYEAQARNDEMTALRLELADLRDRIRALADELRALRVDFAALRKQWREAKKEASRT